MFIKKKKLKYFETLPQNFSLDVRGKYHLKPALQKEWRRCAHKLVMIYSRVVYEKTNR